MLIPGVLSPADTTLVAERILVEPLQQTRIDALNKFCHSAIQEIEVMVFSWSCRRSPRRTVFSSIACTTFQIINVEVLSLVDMDRWGYDPPSAEDQAGFARRQALMTTNCKWANTYCFFRVNNAKG